MKRKQIEVKGRVFLSKIFSCIVIISLPGNKCPGLVHFFFLNETFNDEMKFINNLKPRLRLNRGM